MKRRALFAFEIRKSQGLWFSCIALAAVVLAVLLLIALYAYRQYGMQGMIASLVAAIACWLGATAALVVTKRFRGQTAVTGLFLAMLCRTGFPFLAALVLSNASRYLAEGGVFGAIVAFFLVTLLAETVLSVRMLNSAKEVSKVS